MTKSAVQPPRGATPPPAVADRFGALRPLLHGAQTQRQKMLEDHAKSEAMHKLAQGQAPDYMVISCSDSRYAPTDVFNMEPGHIFEKQHVGAIVGRHDAPAFIRDRGMLATVTFAVAVLKVKHVLILTHTACGAVKHIMGGAQNAKMCSKVLAPALRYVQAAADERDVDVTNPLKRAVHAAASWVAHGVDYADEGMRMGRNAMEGRPSPLDDFTVLAGPVAERVAQHYGALEGSARENAASAETALLQREHLLRYPVVQQALAEGTLEDVHAMVLELDTRVVNVWDEQANKFLPLNGHESGLPERRP